MNKLHQPAKQHTYSLKRRGANKKTAFDKLGEDATLDDIHSAVADGAMEELEERVNDVRDSWETDSLFEDAFAELGSEDTKTEDDEDVSDRCTPDEATRLRHLLRALGPAEFCRRTVDAGVYTTKKLLSAFGIRPPAFLEGADDSAYVALLALAMSRELQKRAKLSRWNSVEDAVELLRTSKNIMVLTGAGISTSLGIPDFRSKGTGLYSQLEHLGLSDPQEVFDIETFRQDPTIFFSVAKDILPATTRFTPTHGFIAMLQEKGKLLTNYTQNIDNLETYAGVRADKMVQCHGSFGTATCQRCRYKMQGDMIFPDIRAGKIPRCPRCVQSLSNGVSTNGRGGKRKRGGANGSGQANKRRRWNARNNDDDDDDDETSDSSFEIPSVGIMKPDITFFGEPLPDEFSRRLTEHDRDRVDLVIVIGTSLKVTPVSEIVSWLPPHIPQMYISKTPITHINFDIDLLGDCDVVIAELCRRAGWDLQHEMVPDGQRVEVRLEDGFNSRHLFEETWPKREKSETTATSMSATAVNGSVGSGIAEAVKGVKAVKGSVNANANANANGIRKSNGRRGSSRGTGRGRGRGSRGGGRGSRGGSRGNSRGSSGRSTPK